jgi:lipid II:glycine glycyltransferase (peptidoglycan interpeptide bridge formation enzyme)
MTTLKKVNEVGIFKQYEAAMTFLKALGYKTDELTLSQMASIKVAMVEAIEATDLRNDSITKVMTPDDKFVMSKLGA